MSLTNLVDTFIQYVLSTPTRFFAEPTLIQFILCTWFVFVVVFRWNIQRHMRYKWLTRYSELKILNCESCFGFWLCLLISTNLTTAAAAYLLFNFYDKD